MTPRTLFRDAKRALVALVVVSALLPTSACVSRKQYAINEAILIGERRQLEDEIYRVQFELRDALEENERLRERLEKNEGNDDSESASERSTEKSQKRAKTSKSNSSFFPGGNSLDVDSSRSNNATDPDAYDDSATSEDLDGYETLPDFVPIPTSRAASARRRSNLATANYVRSPRESQRDSVGQAAYVDPQTNDSDEDSGDDSYNDETDANENVDDRDDDWSPVADARSNVDFALLLLSHIA